MKQILTESIRIDGETQSRVQIDQDAVQEYADAMTAGRKFPPVVAYFDGTEYWCADGFHRVLAALRAGIKHLAAEVQKGGRSEAAWAACGANLTHGIRRSPADKRKAVTLALKMRDGLTDRAIAEHCGVSHTFVAEIRRQLATLPTEKAEQLEVLPPAGAPPPPPTRTGRDGKQYPAPPQRPAATTIGPPPTSRTASAPTAPAAKTAKPEAPVDRLGRRLPERVRELWDRSGEIQDMLTAISRIRTAVRAAQDGSDPLFAEVPFSATLAHLDQAYSGVQVGLPFVVCPFCQGNGCQACRKRGLISKHRWDTTVPRELKAQVERLIEREADK